METTKHVPKITPAGRVEKFAKINAIVASAAPWIGGPIAGVLGGIATDIKIKRVTQFIEDVLVHVEKLHSQESEDFVKSEDFVDIFEKTIKSVANERYEAKRKLFVNYIVTIQRILNLYYLRHKKIRQFSVKQQIQCTA